MEITNAHWEKHGSFTWYLCLNSNRLSVTTPGSKVGQHPTLYQWNVDYISAIHHPSVHGTSYTLEDAKELVVNSYLTMIRQDAEILQEHIDAENVARQNETR